ncbi:MAG: sigma-70 family RNA polymerase sigma factor [Gemmatimonadetes bacterium]|nr:sigma-70 family RNA polymerase sigma factor [Gemmatimonadota bacterium]
METAAETDRASDFEELLQPLLDGAFGLAITMTRNRADAEDAVQEASLRAFRAFDTFERGTNFKAWYYRILTNCVYARHRTAKRRPEAVELDDASELYLFRQTRAMGLHERSNDPARILMGRIDGEMILDAIAAIPDEYRIVASLYFLEDYSYQEIADTVGCPVGTVRSRLHRGRRMLQRMLWAMARDAGILSSLEEENVTT